MELASFSQASMCNLCSVRVKKNIYKDYSLTWKKKHFQCSYKRIIYSWFGNDCILRRLWAKEEFLSYKEYAVLYFMIHCDIANLFVLLFYTL